VSVEKFVKLYGIFGNRRRADGGLDPGPVTPCSLSFLIPYLFFFALVLLEFVILVFYALFMNKYFIVEIF